MSRAEEREDADCVCSVGMKFTWDINDPKLPQDIKQLDVFQEWTDGYVRFIYSAEDKNAQRHLSGWAMRNTNNHNCQILKKSCLGVVVCSRGCALQLRPAICDKARQKQQKKLCPSCSAGLELLPCRGHSGYPVTNFWRVDGKAIFFQAKGLHDHPRPESKSETEARRSSVKRRVSSPPFTAKRRLMEPQALGPALLSCVDPSERLSFMEPSFPQHYPAFQSAEPYYSPHNALGEPGAGLQKAANPRLYVSRPGYDFQGYLTSPSYPMTSDLCDPRVTPVLGPAPSSASAAAPPLGPSSSSTGSAPPAGWKDLLKGSAPYGDNHHYYSSEYPCRYASGAAGSPAGALQTIITTTTKVSYQPCAPPKGAGLPGCSALLDDAPPLTPHHHHHHHHHHPISSSSTSSSSTSSSASFSTEVKVTEEAAAAAAGGGVIKSLSFPPPPLPPEAPPTKPERADGYDYRYSYANANMYRYDDY